MAFKNAAGLVVKTMASDIHSPENLILEGRTYIRTWLEITAQGFEACPVSAIIKTSLGQEYLRKCLHLSTKTQFSMALCYGKGDMSEIRRVRKSYTSWVQLDEINQQK